MFGDNLAEGLGFIILIMFIVFGFLLYFAFKPSAPVRVDLCQKHFNLETKNTTIYEQEKVLHKEDKPARIVIECEVRK